MKSYGHEVRNICNKEIRKVNSIYTCLAVIDLNCALEKDKNS